MRAAADRSSCASFAYQLQQEQQFMSANMEILRALMAASKKKDHEAFLALWVDDDLEYYWSMHAKPITSKEKLRKFLRNYEGSFDQQDWTITHSVEQGDLMLCEGVEMLFDRVNQKLIRNPFMQAVEFRGGKIAKMRDYYYDSVIPAPVRKPAEA
jgi:ketosteroid isomerase-like protein